MYIVYIHVPPKYTVYIRRAVHVNGDYFSPAQFQHVSEHEGLTECADKSQLMPEFGGYLEYVHEDWVRFRMVSSLNTAEHTECSCV